MNLTTGDLVLMVEDDCPLNEWPTGIIKRAFSSQDEKIRKAKVAFLKDNKRGGYLRPVRD